MKNGNRAKLIHRSNRIAADGHKVIRINLARSPVTGRLACESWQKVSGIPGSPQKNDFPGIPGRMMASGPDGVRRSPIRMENRRTDENPGRPALLPVEMERGWED